MEIDNPFDAVSDNDRLTERRVRLRNSQWDALDKLERRLDIPAAALIRLFVDCGLPRTTTQGYTDEGIRRVFQTRNKRR